MSGSQPRAMAARICRPVRTRPSPGRPKKVPIFRQGRDCFAFCIVVCVPTLASDRAPFPGGHRPEGGDLWRAASTLQTDRAEPDLVAADLG